MSTTVTRLAYNAEGTETSALGLPCETVTETFDGSVSVGGLSIDDAFEVEDVDITDNHSTGILALLSDIATVKSQERCIPTDINTPVIKGYKFEDDGETANMSADEIEGTVIDMTNALPSGGITIKGVPVKRLWKCEDISFLELSSSIIMDSRKTMVGYGTEDCTGCVYKIIEDNADVRSALGWGDKACVNDVSVDVEEGNITDYEVKTTKSYYLMALCSKINLDKILGIIGLSVGIGCAVPEWMISAVKTYGIPLKNIMKAYEEWGNVQYAFHADADGKNNVITIPASAYFQSGVNAQTKPRVFTNMAIMSTGDIELWGNNPSSTSTYFANFASCALAYYRYGTTNGASTGASSSVGTFNLWDVSKKVLLDNVLKYTSPNTYSYSESQCGIYVGRSGRATNGYFKFKFFAIYDGDELVRFYVPFYRDSVLGCLDLINMTFKTNEGSDSFTYSLE